MVIKIQSTHRSMAGTLAYNQDKVDAGVARVVGAVNIPGYDGGARTVSRVFESYEWRNIKTENVSFQMSINPNPNRPDEKLTDGEVMSLSRKLLDGLGYGGQPLVVYQHRDIERTHYHVVSIRTNLEGKKIRDSFEERNLQRLMSRYSREYHYAIGNQVPEREAVMEERIQGGRSPVEAPLRFDPEAGDVRRQYLDVFNEALRWRFTTFTQFQTITRSMGVDARAVEGDGWTVVLQGLGADGRGARAMISEKEMGAGLYALFESRAAECRGLRPRTAAEREETRKAKWRIARTVSRCLERSRSEAHLARMLERDGIAMTLSRGADGSIFGATFADWRTRTAYKASELGEGVSVSLFREADGVTGGRWASDEASGQEEVGGKKDIGHDESVAGKILEAALEMSEGAGGSGARDPQAEPDKRRKRRKPRYTS